MTKEEAALELEKLISEGRINIYGYSDDIVKQDIEQFFLADYKHKHVLSVEPCMDNKYIVSTKVVR